MHYFRIIPGPNLERSLNNKNPRNALLLQGSVSIFIVLIMSKTDSLFCMCNEGRKLKAPLSRTKDNGCCGFSSEERKLVRQCMNAQGLLVFSFVKCTHLFRLTLRLTCGHQQPLEPPDSLCRYFNEKLQLIFLDHITHCPRPINIYIISHQKLHDKYIKDIRQTFSFLNPAFRHSIRVLESLKWGKYKQKAEKLHIYSYFIYRYFPW